MPLLVQPGAGGSAFHAVQQQPRSLHQGLLHSDVTVRLLDVAMLLSCFRCLHIKRYGDT